jgi:hypothetical protein
MDDGSKEQPKITAGLDIGDKYSSYLCLIDTPRGHKATLRFSRAAFAHRDRGGNPLAVG